MKEVGEPDAADPHVRFDGREVETGKDGRTRLVYLNGTRLNTTEVSAPRHLSTLPDHP